MKYFPARLPLVACLSVLVCIGNAQEIQPLSARLGVAKARTQREAIQLQGTEYIIPQLILGGEWTSTIKLSNRGTKPYPITNVYFVAGDGTPMRATFQTSAGNVTTDTGFSFFLGIGSVIEVTFFGDATVKFGSGFIGCNADGCGTPGLYGEVTLRNRNSTRPDFESVFPLETPAALQYMLFDGRNGITTVLYLVSASTSPTTVSIDILNTSNNLVRTVNIPLKAEESQILTLHVLAQETIGIQGTLAIRSPANNVFITATGLRINPSNSFAPIRAFVPRP